LARLIRFEAVKAIHQPLLLVAFGLTMLVTVAVGLSHGARHEGDTEVLNGFACMAEAAKHGNFFASAFLLMYAATLMSREAAGATLKTVLTRPVRRVHFFLAKAVTLAAAAALFLLAVMLASHLLGGVQYGYGDVYTFSEGRPVNLQIAYEELWRLQLLTFALAYPPLLAVTAFGLFWSVWLDNVGAAVIAAMLAAALLWGVTDFFGERRVSLLSRVVDVRDERLRHYLFNDYAHLFFDRLARLAAASAERWPEREARLGPVVCVLWALFFFGVAGARFTRRDILA
ncbi:MAG: ABC transporter permease, partial [Planctomycetes bacterium]|nr:ABC transporter permease [Planctomycetota bacterium]